MIIYVCEDRFNLEEDMLIYLEFKMMDVNQCMKPDVVQHLSLKPVKKPKISTNSISVQPSISNDQKDTFSGPNISTDISRLTDNTSTSDVSSSNKMKVHYVDETEVERIFVKTEPDFEDEDRILMIDVNKDSIAHKNLEKNPLDLTDIEEKLKKGTCGNGIETIEENRLDKNKDIGENNGLEVGNPANGPAPLEECTREEQRAVLRFLSSEGLKPFVILKRLKAQYGKAVMSKQMLYVWDKKFKSGVSKVTDSTRPGRPNIAESPELIELVEKIIRDNRRATIRDMALQLGISHGTSFKIVHELLQLQKISQRWVPRTLVAEAKERRIDVCEELLGRYQFEGDDFLRRIVTGDEIWIYWQNVEQESDDDGPSGPKKPREKCNLNKMLLTVFWDFEGPICEHYSCSSVPFYDLFQFQLKPQIEAKRPELPSKGVLLLVDNPRPQMMYSSVAMINDLHFECLPHPPFSPDLAPCDFHMFWMLKDCLTGRIFDNEEEVQTAIHDWLNDQPKEFFEKGMKYLLKRWHACVDNNGDYFQLS